jgi:GT2 family glycosyltransferase
MPQFFSTVNNLGARGLVQLGSAALTRFTEKPLALAQLIFDRPLVFRWAKALGFKKEVGQARTVGFCVVVADGHNDAYLLDAVNSCLSSGVVFSRTVVLDLTGVVGSSSINDALERLGVPVTSVANLLNVVSTNESGLVYFLRCNARWERYLLPSWLEAQIGDSPPDVFWGDVRVIPTAGLSSIKSFPTVHGEFPFFRLPQVPFFGVKREHLSFAKAKPGGLRRWSDLIDGVNASFSMSESVLVSKASPILVSERQGQPISPTINREVETSVNDRIEKLARPLISVIVPTRDKAGLLESCVNSVRQSSKGWNVELVILDNGSKELETLDYLDSLDRTGAVIVRDPGEFNFAKLINRGVEESSGSFCVILNNDVVVKDSSWLTKAIAVASRNGVGAVGFKLLYADGRVQHSGVTIGYRGSAGHFFRGQDNAVDKFPGLSGVWPVEAVTGACMVVEVAKFRLAQGMDEKLAVGLNDVDFCLRLGRLGLTNYVLCESEIVHLESASRGLGFTCETLPRAIAEIAHFRNTWGIGSRTDKFFNKRFWLATR